MKKLLGILLVSCAFLVAGTYSVLHSPSVGVYSKVEKQDLLSSAEISTAPRVEPVYGNPVTVYAVDAILREYPKEVVPSANSPPRHSWRGADT